MVSRFPFRFGVYQIRNKQNGHRYVGSAGGRTLQQRLRDHIRALERGVHHNAYLQRACNLYGLEMFEFTPLLFCDKEDVLFYEQLAIDAFQPEYNLCPTAGNSTGYKHTAHNKRRMSRLKQGVYAGSKHPRAKLDESDVIVIKRLIRLGLNNTDIGRRFNVNNRTISNIKHGISWKHVD